MFASIIIVILAVLFGSLSIFVQYIKDPERRKKIEDAVSIPAALALFGAIAWLMPNAHHLDDLGVSPLALGMALVFFLIIPAVTYIFSPAFKDAGNEDSRPQNDTTPQAQPVSYSTRPAASATPCRSVIVFDDFVINSMVIDGEIVEEDPRFLLE